MLAVAAWLVVGSTPAAVAAPTLSLTRLTAIPQLGGELTLQGRTSDPDLAGLSVEVWAGSAAGWRPTNLPLRATGDGGFDVVVPLDRSPLDVGGHHHYRLAAATSGEQPAATSPTLSVYVVGGPTTPFTSAPYPTVTGIPTVGATLQAVPGTWAPTPAGVGFRWNRDGVSTGVTGASYRLTAADLGRRITVTAVGFPKDGSGQTYRDSRPGTPVSPGTFTTTPPEIVGRAIVGELLRAEVSGWSPAPTTLGYQWLRDGTAIDGSTAATHTIGPEDAGTTLSVAVHAETVGVAATDRTSAGLPIPVLASARVSLGSRMTPLSTQPWTSADLTWRIGLTSPAWSATTRTRWDAPGAFTHSQVPQPLFTLASTMFGVDWARAANGAEYPGTNPSVKNADVSFRVTGRRFAIAYQGTRAMDAMVWIDGRPVTGTPIPTQSPTETGHALNWITVELPARRTVGVRFAGPRSFVGVDAPAADDVVVTAAAPEHTVGVLSDSFFETCAEALCMSRSAAVTLGSLTGWGVWNFSESGTGFLNAASSQAFGPYQSGVFGSPRRLAAISQAPIDLLVVSGSMNDVVAANYSVAGHRAAVTTFLTELAALRPDLPVVLVGIEPMGVLKAQVWDDRARALTANLAAMVGRHPNVVGFIDPYTDRWLTGTGSIASPQGDGNQDRYIGVDGAHPSVAGVAYYVGRIVEEMRTLRVPAP
ncbi:hypothetical protein ACFQ0K_05715 [Nocardioides caeni]|uniref:SGNH hydrolase-type esterase domain-containing protein n=1 Tax=Nocardioides caeni TaxID=574700 RepID=A0A4S8N7E7_9ACTN|nr:hypothetical protein [Nocardioides caeni]THV12183.1 hypothetical protein E9934_12625 [Nocardioides caeni]